MASPSSLEDSPPWGGLGDRAGKASEELLFIELLFSLLMVTEGSGKRPTCMGGGTEGLNCKRAWLRALFPIWEFGSGWMHIIIPAFCMNQCRIFGAPF